MLPDDEEAEFDEVKPQLVVAEEEPKPSLHKVILFCVMLLLYLYWLVFVEINTQKKTFIFLFIMFCFVFGVIQYYN